MTTRPQPHVLSGILANLPAMMANTLAAMPEADRLHVVSEIKKWWRAGSKSQPARPACPSSLPPPPRLLAIHLQFGCLKVPFGA